MAIIIAVWIWGWIIGSLKKKTTSFLVTTLMVFVVGVYLLMQSTTVELSIVLTLISFGIGYAMQPIVMPYLFKRFGKVAGTFVFLGVFLSIIVGYFMLKYLWIPMAITGVMILLVLALRKGSQTTT